MYSNCCCICSFEPEIIKICQSSHKMYSSNIVNFQDSLTILNGGTKKKKKSGNLLNALRNKNNDDKLAIIVNFFIISDIIIND